MSDNNADVYRAIGDEGGVEALSLVATVVEANANASYRLQASLYESECAAHERTKARLIEAENQLAVIHDRVMNLLFAPPKDYELEAE